MLCKSPEPLVSYAWTNHFVRKNYVLRYSYYMCFRNNLKQNSAYAYNENLGVLVAFLTQDEAFYKWDMVYKLGL